MNEKKKPATDKLRQKAIEILEKRGGQDPSLYEADLEHLIQELSIYQVELEYQNDELRKTQSKLEESRDRFFDLYHNAPVGYATVNEDGLIEEINSKAAGLLEADHYMTLTGKPFTRHIYPEDQDTFYLNFQKGLKEKGSFSCELRLVVKDQEKPLFVRLEGIPDTVKAQDGNGRIRVSIIDITEQKAAEEKIKASLREKEVLLRELYHRTKNSMMVIMSMLDLHTRNIRDESVLQVFRETSTRIRSMALVHEKLYQGRDLSMVDLKAYFMELTGILAGNYRSGDTVAVTFDMDYMPVSIDSAVPCGLIVNELVSNSFKHAFPGRREGEIHLSMKAKDDEIEICVRDNGVGLPQGFDYRHTDSYGLQSAVALAEHQLQGRFSVGNGKKGTAFCIRFRDTEEKVRV